MSSDLLSIAQSGAAAAKVALDVTGQNIANANTTGYVRRSVNLEEVTSPGYSLGATDVSLSGVQVTGVVRNADAFRQSEVRRTNADSSRSTTALSGYQDALSAVENSNVYTEVTNFVTATQALAQSPNSTSQRTATLQAASTMANAFNLASTQLAAVTSGQQTDAANSITQVNTIAQQLAQTNIQISASATDTNDTTNLYDQRDQLLQQLSGYADIATSFAANGTVSVTLGGASGAPLVQNGTAQSLSMTTATNGTIAYKVGTGTVTLSGGSLAGNQIVLSQVQQSQSALDTLASGIATTVNTAQANGVDLQGNPGAALFSGTTAATLSLTTTDGALIATAPAGAAAGSVDVTNLTALNQALSTSDPAGAASTVITTLSSTVASQTTTNTALTAIASAAATALSNQAGVNLDTEAVNLTQFQQAFQANGQVMEVAQTVFNTILSLK